jgi:hypothetical protein
MGTSTIFKSDRAHPTYSIDPHGRQNKSRAEKDYKEK